MSRAFRSTDPAERRAGAPRIGAWAVGAAATLVGVLLHASGALDRLDAAGYDALMRAGCAVEADPRIVVVGIDDATLERVGRWPWPRRTLAGLIDALAAHGATQIVLDLTFTAPQELRVEPPTVVDPHSANDLARLEVTGAIIPDDLELAAAMRRAGNVIIGVRAEGEGLTSQETPEDVARQTIVAGAAEALVDDFSLTRQDLERVTGWREGTPFPVAEAKKLAARRLSEAFLNREPQGGLSEFLASAPGLSAAPVNSADADELRRAFDRETAKRSLLARWPAAHASVLGVVPRLDELAPPIPVLADAARDAGGVVVHPQGTDPVLRSIPLTAVSKDRLVAALSLQAAARICGFDLAQARIERGSLVLPRRGHVAPGEAYDPLQIPLVSGGEALIPWAAAERSGAPHRWENTFRQLPAASVLRWVNRREALEANEVRRQWMLSRVVEAAARSTPEVFAAYAARVRERNALRRKRRLADSRDERERLDGRITALSAEMSDVEARALEWLDMIRASCREQDNGAETPPECAEVAAYEAHFTSEGARAFEDMQARIREEIAVIESELRPVLAGGICLVGLVGSGVGDFVPTPVDERCPGVVAHAHALNALLTGQLLIPLSPVAQSVLLVMAGVLATIAGARLRSGASIVCAGLIAAACAIVAWLMLRWNLTVFSWAPACATAGAAWVSVLAYRQATEERARRAMTRVLGQYTSPAVAAGIAAQAREGAFEPARRNVTCFFSDLADSTRIGEQLGPDAARRWLQPYLATVSDVLIAEQALVNKFVGDGVFAFFNAPLLPCPDAPVRACRAALTCLQRMRAVRSDLPAWRLRIGIATGDAAVGDFGTERKKDYTSIGDPVNVAARLERANKALGTHVLVDAATHRDAGSAFRFRCVGLLAVEGRSAPVEAFELLDEASASQADLGAVEALAEALLAFQRRDWDVAERTLIALAEAAPTDGVVAFYRARIARFRSQPPPQDWRGEVAVGGA
ncbi:MAG: CHASE2 domain-containing protein [Phycisphaerae bacterium]|nr:MAG: CHASE2 domain-containing protein [Planctomycetota bacterium]KAB2946694.1 MAG: CHASE2 domain-containing protein [Phycisphaerae bacterium]MBE7455602.1 CHASE2 domain-containing protein [Planctomycetia bacterium]MCK6463239.1 CHASE2 domain-containing protein [Phycisphaerae bacterium]MCL4716859.1 CHASE2 domain-containing protein [Phycisphaerae bacterium]